MEAEHRGEGGTCVLVQARMSSRRLPGKVLRHLAGQPLLGHLLSGLEHSKGIDGIIVTTSTDTSDNAIAEYCHARGLRCHRGSLKDVAGRMLAAAVEYAVADVVRVNADSPLLHPELVDAAVSVYRSGDYDLVTNVHPRSYPTGQSVEVLGVSTLRKIRARSKTQGHLEHVTLYCYEHAPEFRIKNLQRVPSAAHVSMTVDYAHDAARIERLMRKLDRPHWEMTVDALITAADDPGTT